MSITERFLKYVSFETTSDPTKKSSPSTNGQKALGKEICSDLKEMGIDTVFVQDNMSYSAQKGTLRGLHYQKAPYSQAKLVRCTKGKVIDVAVDIRKGSPTYGKWTSCELSAENKRMFFIPKGMAHGFLTLTDDVEFQYKCDELYNKEAEGGIRYNDPTINVDWGSLLNGIEPVLSEKDKTAPKLEDCNANFIY